MIAGGNDRLYRAICAVLGLAELVDDPRFRTNPDRVRTATSCRAARGAAAPRSGHLARAARRRRASRQHRSPTRATSRSRRRPRPSGSSSGSTIRASPDLTLAALPLSFDRERALHPRAPPDVGEHSAEVLREAGYADEEIAELAAAGVTTTYS